MNDDLNPYAPPAARLEQENPDGSTTTSPEEESGKRFFNYLIDLGVCGFVLLPSLFLIRKLFSLVSAELRAHGFRPSPFDLHSIPFLSLHFRRPREYIRRRCPMI